MELKVPPHPFNAFGSRYDHELVGLDVFLFLNWLLHELFVAEVFSLISQVVTISSISIKAPRPNDVGLFTKPSTLDMSI